MPTSPILGLPQPFDGEFSPQITLNTAIEALEAATQGTSDVSFAATSTVTLSQEQFIRSFIFNVTSATGALTLQVPDKINGNATKRVFVVRNTTNGVVTVQTTLAGGATAVVPARETRLLGLSDNAIYQAAQPHTPVSFIALADTPKTYAGGKGKVLVVNTTETGIELIAITDTIDRFEDVDTTDRGQGKVLTYIDGVWVPRALETQITSFLALNDTPDQYINDIGKFVRVSGDAGGLEFVAIRQVPTGQQKGQVLVATANGYAWADPTNTLPSLVGQAERVLAVKPDETGVEWVPQGMGGGDSGYDTNITARQWRAVTLAAGGSSYVGYAEMIWRDKDGAILSTGGTPLSSSDIDAGRSIAKAYDGLLITGDTNGWLTGSTDNVGSWGGYDFVGGVMPITLDLYPWNDASYQPTRVRIDYRDSTTGAWTEFKSFDLGPRVYEQPNTLELQAPYPWIEEAPKDMVGYVRKDGEWVPETVGGTGGVEEAPRDGTPYSRQNGGWVASPTGGTGGGGGDSTPTVPTTPGAVSFRYMHLSGFVPGADAASISRLRFRFNGADQPNPVIVEDKINSESYPFSAALDNSGDTFFSTFGGSPNGHILLDFGANVVIDEISVTNRIEGNIKQAPVSFRVAVGTDANALPYSMVAQFPTAGWTTNTQERKVGMRFIRGGLGTGAAAGFGEHRYWRVAASSRDNRYLLAHRLVFAATLGGAQQATGGTALASGMYGSGTAPSFAFDNNDATYWEGNSAEDIKPYATWIGYDFGRNVEVNEVRWTVKSNFYADEWPTNGMVQYSDDGLYWVTAWAFGVAWVDPGNNSFLTKSFRPLAAGGSSGGGASAATAERKIVAPILSDFSIVTAAPANVQAPFAAEQMPYGIDIAATAGFNRDYLFSWLLKPVPAQPVSVIARAEGLATQQTTAPGFGIGFRNASNGYGLAFTQELYGTGCKLILRVTQNDDRRNADAITVTVNRFYPWMRATQNGSFHTFWVSVDGRRWYPVMEYEGWLAGSSHAGLVINPPSGDTAGKTFVNFQHMEFIGGAPAAGAAKAPFMFIP